MNYEEQGKSGEPSRKKRGNKFGYIKGTILSCPHCTSFNHTRQLEIDKHIFETHGIYPYNCPVCGKGLRCPSVVNRHIKNFLLLRNNLQVYISSCLLLLFFRK